MQEVHEKEWLSPLELDGVFDIKLSTQVKMRASGTLPYSKIGKFVRYNRKKIIDILESSEVHRENIIDIPESLEVHHEK